MMYTRKHSHTENMHIQQPVIERQQITLRSAFDDAKGCVVQISERIYDVLAFCMRYRTRYIKILNEIVVMVLEHWARTK